MGNAFSKAGKNSRVLGKAVPQKTATGTVNSTRPTAPKRHAEETLSGNTDAEVAKRMQELGPVKFKQMEEKYVPASQEAFTMTLEARKRREEQGSADVEKEGPKKLLPSVTISAILRSLKEGDSPESVARTYNLDKSVLPRLAKLSVPDRPKTEGPNQLLDEEAPRQPVRRRRRESKEPAGSH